MAYISVAIVTYRDNLNLKKCLESLNKQQTNNKYELTVINNDKDDNVCENLVNQYKNKNCIRKIFLTNQENNIGKARRLATDLSTCELIMFTDSDCILPENWIDKHIDNYQRVHKVNSKCAGVGSSFNIPKTRKVISILSSLTYKSCFAQLKSPQGLELEDDHTAVDHLPTLNSLFNRQVLKLVGNFSDKYSVAGEDLDLGMRLNKNGFYLYFFKEPHVTHYIQNTLSSWWKRCYKYGSVQMCTIINNRKILPRHLLILSWIIMLSLFTLLPGNFIFQWFFFMYLILLFASSLYTCWHNKVSIKLVFTLTIFIVCTHFVYSLGFISSLISMIVLFFRGFYELYKHQYRRMVQWTNWL